VLVTVVFDTVLDTVLTDVLDAEGLYVDLLPGIEGLYIGIYLACVVVVGVIDGNKDVVVIGGGSETTG